MGVGVAEGPESVVVFLAGGIPKGKLNVLAVDLDIGDVVLEHGGDVDLFVGDTRNAKWRFSAKETHKTTPRLTARLRRGGKSKECTTDLWERSLGEDDQETSLWVGDDWLEWGWYDAIQ